MATSILGGTTANIGAALPAGMTEEDLAKKNLAEANQHNALRVDGSGNTVRAFDSGGNSTGGANTPAVNPGVAAGGILSQPATSSTTSTSSTQSSTPTPQSLGLPATWTISPDQTVEGRINNLTDPNNPLIAQARSRALGTMNGRGLLNSSIAMGAADSAAYDAATPIATADAANASKVAGYNTDQKNQFAIKNLDDASNR